ncbi:hypothetical protein COURTHOUSE_220 [Mycobacterium phage Courthouse]|uniref:Uncharacterized protein n=2 Tax=Omegavirus courthouse TaxID=1089119 RepID=G8I5S5_9CAUD|nr:hypothetical protein CM09_gp204 [Mycobacterium phage Courthouse]YP_009205351.1 hypothetical protein AVT17_gp209 [Mycobacterium phage Ariel]AER48069.1 hypothetical protein COURTHOUSE_220 [Mycobacterium phage Courthouse]AIM50098.1 hypothetical protein PBI_ARIEL_223 [Mycobacterium phage Ariel]ATS93054.1 hypothetical protein SEA_SUPERPHIKIMAN_216 [Mycobacterium phage Superphikiman]
MSVHLTGPHDDEDPVTIEYQREFNTADSRADFPIIAVNVWMGYDGVPVVQIDTNTLTGRMRVNLNETTLWDGDPDQ